MADPIVFERIIDATPDEAFNLFTQPERLRRWQAVSASVDLRVGGEYRLTVVPGRIASGAFTEIEPGRRVVYTWGWQDSDDVPPGSSTIEVDIEPVGEKTRVRLTHSGLDAEAAASHAEGWNHYCDRLSEVASSGDAGPDEWSAGPEEHDHLSAAEASWHICQNVMRNFGPDDRERQTPCAEYTVHELVEHLMGSMRGLGGMAGAEIPEQIDAETAEDYIAQAVEPALAAWRERGVEGEVPFGDGNAPAALPAGILTLEFLIHAWDFAKATDQTIDVSPHLTAFVQGLADAIIKPENRGEGRGFDAETQPSSDDPLIALMAFTGRKT